MIYMTSQDLADRWQMSARHVVNVVTKKKGFPKSYKFGNSLRWDKAEVVKWEARQKVDRAA